MTLKNKLPVPYLIFLSLLIFVISIFVAVFSVEHGKLENNSSTTEIKDIVTDKNTEKVTINKTTTKKDTIVASTTKGNTEYKNTTVVSITNKTTQQQTTTKQTTTKQATPEQSMTKKEFNSNTYFTKSDAEVVAKILYEECRGVSSETQKACVVWVICNRVDSGMGSSIQSVAKAKNQFDYNPHAPIKPDLYNLAQDVLSRWEREKNGESNVGRVLPKGYLYFHGDGVRNYFRNSFKKPYSTWDYSLPTPYKT